MIGEGIDLGVRMCPTMKRDFVVLSVIVRRSESWKKWSGVGIGKVLDREFEGMVVWAGEGSVLYSCWLMVEIRGWRTRAWFMGGILVAMGNPTYWVLFLGGQARRINGNDPVI